MYHVRYKTDNGEKTTTCGDRKDAYNFIARLHDMFQGCYLEIEAIFEGKKLTDTEKTELVSTALEGKYNES